MKLSKIGIDPRNSEALNSKIEMSNKLSVFLFTLGVLNVLNFIIQVPEALIYPIGTVIPPALTLLFNHFKQYTAARLAIAFPVLVVIFLYQATAFPAGLPASDATVLLALAFSIMPFALFMEEEKGLMFGIFLFNAVLVGLISQASDLIAFKKDLDVDKLNAFDIQLGVKLSAIAIIAMIFYNFIKASSRHLKSNSKLKEEVEKQNEELLLSKTEMEDQLKELARTRENEALRNETVQQLSNLNSILRNADDLSEVYDEAVSFLVKSVKANQAGLYVVEKDESTENQFIQMKACYAYNRKKYIDQRIEIGEGLLGQAYLERDKVMLTEIPQKYTRITSGLGDATPDCILILPMIHQDKVEGLLEIAAFHVFKEHEIAMLEQACVSLASEISAYRVQLSTQFLLEEAQSQAEQMRAQEEEMRQNMEELQATQEAMERKEKEMSELMKKLEEKEQNKEQSVN